MAAVLVRIAPSRLLASGVRTDALSHDPAVAEAYLADPLVSRKVSPAWFRAAQRAQGEVVAGAPSFPVPALVMASGDDRLADPAAVREWASRAPKDRTTFVEWPGFFHEMFNEIGKERVLARVAAWLESAT
jgi:alpha-beta hydrolase superfamily lysophospholipase